MERLFLSWESLLGLVRQAGGFPLVATLHFKPSRNQVPDEPDVYAEATDAWVVYPWATEVWLKT